MFQHFKTLAMAILICVLNFDLASSIVPETWLLLRRFKMAASAMLNLPGMVCNDVVYLQRKFGYDRSKFCDRRHLGF